MINPALDRLPGSAFVRLRALLGPPVLAVGNTLAMSIGEPQLSPPAWVAEIIAANAPLWNRHPSNDGTPALRPERRAGPGRAGHRPLRQCRGLSFHVEAIQRAGPAFRLRRGRRRHPARLPEASFLCCGRHAASPIIPVIFAPTVAFLWLRVGDGEAVAKRFWQEGGIRVVPGRYLTADDPRAASGNSGHPYVRIALVHDETTVESALSTLHRILDHPA